MTRLEKINNNWSFFLNPKVLSKHCQRLSYSIDAGFSGCHARAARPGSVLRHAIPTAPGGAEVGERGIPTMRGSAIPGDLFSDRLTDSTDTWQPSSTSWLTSWAAHYWRTQPLGNNGALQQTWRGTHNGARDKRLAWHSPLTSHLAPAWTASSWSRDYSLISWYLEREEEGFDYCCSITACQAKNHCGQCSFPVHLITISWRDRLIHRLLTQSFCGNEQFLLQFADVTVSLCFHDAKLRVDVFIFVCSVFLVL